MTNTLFSIGYMVFPVGLSIFLFVVNAKYGMHAQASQTDMQSGALTPMDGAVFGSRGMFGVMY